MIIYKLLLTYKRFKPNNQQEIRMKITLQQLFIKFNEYQPNIIIFLNNKDMHRSDQILQTPLIVKHGSTVYTLEPDTLLYKLFTKQLGIAKKKKIRYAFMDKIMKFNAASYYGNDKDSHCHLLDNQHSYASYIVASNDLNQWVEASSDTPKKIIGVIIQGRFKDNQWVKKYRLSYSNDGTIFHSLFGAQQFDGNTDNNTKVRNIFQTPVQARFIRLHPNTWNGHTSFRIDFLIEEE